MENNDKTKKPLPFAKFPANFDVSKLKAVSFDAYGTILFSKTEMTPPTHKIWSILCNFIRYHTGLRYTPEKLCQKFFYYKDVEKKAGLEKTGGEPFEINEIEVYRHLMPGAKEENFWTAAQIFRATTADPSFDLYRGVKEFMLAAKQHGLKISMSSNAQKAYNFWELKALGIDKIFDNPTMESGLSSEIGFQKPSTKFFQCIVKNLGVQPHEILNVGNWKNDDITPARAIGMHTCLVNSERQEVNTPDGCDFFFDYPDEEDLPSEYYPFPRLQKFLFG